MGDSTKKKRDTRDVLYDAALKVFGEQGYKDATIEEIAAEAGVARGVFYYYFSSKTDLVEHILENSNEELIDAFNEAVRPGMTTEEMFITLTYTMFERVLQQSDIARFIFSEVWHHEEEWRETLGHAMNEIIEIFGDVIAQGQREGIFASDLDISFVSQMIFSQICTTSAACSMGYIEADPEVIAHQLTRFIFIGLKACGQLGKESQHWVVCQETTA